MATQKKRIARPRVMFNPWTPTQEQALALTFEGRWSVPEVAAKCGVALRTLEGWRSRSQWRERLEAMRADLAESLRDVTYASKAARIIALSQMAEAARRQYEAHETLQEVRPSAGGDITNESFNRDAHAAFRDALNDIAKELGERTANVNIQATVAQFGVNVVLESMRNDPSNRGRIRELISSVAGATR